MLSNNYWKCSSTKQGKEDLLERIQELEDRLNLYEEIIEHAPVSIFVKDKTKTNILNNKKDRETLGKTYSEIHGKSNEELFSGDNLKKVNAIDDEVLTTGKTITLEEELEFQGKTRHFLATRGPFYNSKGELEGIFGISQDITEIKHLREIQIQQQNFESINTLVMGLTHDINNIVHTIINQSELLSQMLTESQQLEILGKLQHTAKIASDLFKNLQLIGKDHDELNIQPIDINQLVSEVLSLLEIEQHENVTVNLDLTNNLPPLKILKNHLTQIVMNLVLNGIESLTAGGTITIASNSLTITSSEQKRNPYYLNLKPGAYNQIKISDTGKGIHPKDLPKIFNPYYSTKSNGNTGLGLFITYKLVRQYDGEIFVSTEIDEGTTFEVVLPVSS